MNNNEASARLSSLRSQLATQQVDGFLLPVADEFLGEYVPDCAQRLRWLTGFSGSAGMAAVLPSRAALFVDGRYTIQARMEVDASLYEIINIAEMKPEEWAANAMSGGALAYDPMLHSMREAERIEKALVKKNIRLAPLRPNPVDALWKGRPAAPASEIFIHENRYAGETHEKKRLKVADHLCAQKAGAVLLAATDSINWLLNIRGADLAYSPMALGYALVRANGTAALYVEPARAGAALRAHLGDGVAIRPPVAMEDDLRELAATAPRILLDPALTPAYFAQLLAESGAEIIRGDDPCQLPKAVKNPVELAGIRAAHLRDGLALTRFLCWLEAAATKGGVRESQAAAKLLEYRRAAPDFFSPSFETIAGSGPNGAIVHYRVTPETDRALEPGDLFLIDSGGQYLDGTTDITRTVLIGGANPPADARDRFTRVLKGHIALARARFPEGTSGSQLDALARAPLWEAGVDFDHGTGHGVGCFLSVHEGPQRISRRGGDVALAAGMVVSNEPGYYREGAYGIRIESLVAVVEAGAMENGKARLGFETLSLVPIERRLINAVLLTPAEKEWLNAYHAGVLAAHSPALTATEKTWLEAACAPIS